MWKVEENVETGATGYKFDFFFLSVDWMPEVFIVIKTAKGKLFSPLKGLLLTGEFI